jgi:hypothetical protein
MSNEPDDLDIGSMIDERLATLFRELCRRELLGERETAALVSQATERPAGLRAYPGAPTLALRGATMQRASAA